MEDMGNADFGFFDYASSKENVSILVLSGFTILPNAGGWNDQYEDEAADILTHLRGIAWARSLKEDRTDSEKSESQDNIDGVANTGDWQNLFK